MALDIREQLQASLGDTHTIERELGGGGMSRTYISLERALSRRVVIKVLSPELSAGVSVERFKREILLAAQLQHPHIVPVLASGDAGGLPWFTMPFVEGESLRQRLSRGPLSIGEATGILKDVARALEFAHARGVVHRDIKPDNVLLAGSSATVTDFGIAKALSAARTGGAGATLTVAGTSIGTPAYMAPEQAAGDPVTDHRADLYSFGCMAYELLAGRPPFQATSPAKLLGAHLGEKPRDVRELRPDAPESLAALVMHCLEKDPDDRPQQASELVHVLDAVTSSGAAPSAPGILTGRVHVGKALGLWAATTALVSLTAWAATVVIGLPDWVLPGSIGVMLAGLPIIGFTAWVQRVAHRAYTATPTYTPGGTATAPQGTLHTIAIKASPHVSWKRTWMGGAIAVAGFVVLVVGWMVLRALGIGPSASLIGAGKLGAGDRIIITDFANPAGDSTLGVTVTEALRADLTESSVLRVLPRLATVGVLRLMRRPVDSRIDFDLARTIATREGLKAVLDGDIVSHGGRYLISTRLISADGQQLATFNESAESDNDLIPAVGRLGKQIRTKAGESLKEVRESGALDRVTTGSLEALRRYTAGNLAFDQSGDTRRAISFYREAVEIDSTFAMAWRRLGLYYVNTGQRELGRDALAHAYQFVDRLSEDERQLTLAGYYEFGPEPNDEKALAAYEALVARDSLNVPALNDGALLLFRKNEPEKALSYFVRAAAASGRTPQPFTNGLGLAVALGRWQLADSVLSEFRRLYPTNPSALFWPARLAFARGNLDSAAALSAEVQQQLPPLAAAHDFDGDLALLRGRIRQSEVFRKEARALQSRTNARGALITAMLDSANLAALILDDPQRARLLFDRGLQRVQIDSIPLIERSYSPLLQLAAQLGDSARARHWAADYRAQLKETGRTIDGPAYGEFADALVSVARGRYDEALTHLQNSERMNVGMTPGLVAPVKFMVFNRLQMADSAIAVGEQFAGITWQGRLARDGLYLANIHQRLGELYEAKGNIDKALEQYNAFVELWKDADPELQPRVKDVRGRIQRLQRGRG